jgi:hypothetical protein
MVLSGFGAPSRASSSVVACWYPPMQNRVAIESPDPAIRFREGDHRSISVSFSAFLPFIQPVWAEYHASSGRLGDDCTFRGYGLVYFREPLHTAHLRTFRNFSSPMLTVLDPEGHH